MSLEQNIERIADALEIIAKVLGTKIPIEEKSAAKQPSGSPPEQQDPGQPFLQQGQQGMWQGPSFQIPQQMPQGGPIPVSLPAGTGMPRPGIGNDSGIAWNGNYPPQQAGASFPNSGSPAGQQPGSQPAPPVGSSAVPTTATAQQYTFDQLAVATANLASSGKDVFPILGKFGINMLMDLPQERFGEFAAALREAGAVI